MRLSLQKGGAPLKAQRSALAVVTFALDRHRYSGEQLANVLTADGILCYSDETTRVRWEMRAWYDGPQTSDRNRREMGPADEFRALLLLLCFFLLTNKCT